MRMTTRMIQSHENFQTGSQACFPHPRKVGRRFLRAVI